MSVPALEILHEDAHLLAVAKPAGVLTQRNARGETGLEDEVRRTPDLGLCVDVHDVPKLMAWAHAAVSAAGSTSWELAFMGVPTLSVVLADNQAPVAAAGRVGARSPAAQPRRAAR